MNSVNTSRKVQFKLADKEIEFNLDGESAYGEDLVLLDKEDDLTQNSNFTDSGYTVAKFLSPENNLLIRESIKKIIYDLMLKVSKQTIALEDFDLTQYHKLVNDEEHFQIITPFRTWLDINLLALDYKLIEKRISEILKLDVTCLAPDRAKTVFAIRIVRPQSNDFNPPHRDPWLDILKNAVNIYYPICGSCVDSSLPLVPSSHRWKESEIERTVAGAKVNGSSYTVPSVVGSTKDLSMIRPDPNLDEVLVFSPYLIHGGAYNFQKDITRISLEMRFWRK